MYCGWKFLLCAIILSGYCVVAATCPCPDENDDFEAICPCQNDDGSLKPEYIQDQIASNQPISCALTEPITVTMNGESVELPAGEIEYDGTKLTTENTVKVSGTEATDVKGFSATSEGYTIDEVALLEDSTRTIISATGVVGTSTTLDLGTAVSVQDNPALVGTTNDYSSAGDTFTVGKAGTVLIGENLFSEIKDSTFTVTHEVLSADVTSAKDLNSLKVGDMEIFVDEGDNVMIEKMGDRYNVKADGRIVDHSAQGYRITLRPGARYEYTGTEYEQYAIENPGTENLRFCIRKFTEVIENCNIVDLLYSVLDFQGAVEYERMGADNFLDIIKSDDFNMQSTEVEIENGHVFSGPFEVKLEDQFYYRYHLEVPYVVKSIVSSIVIDESGFLRRELADTTFTMYSDAAKDSFIQKYTGLLP